MPMKGRFPIRRTLQYLSQGDVVFKDSVKVMTVNYNTRGELGEGARSVRAAGSRQSPASPLETWRYCPRPTARTGSCPRCTAEGDPGPGWVRGGVDGAQPGLPASGWRPGSPCTRRLRASCFSSASRLRGHLCPRAEVAVRWERLPPLASVEPEPSGVQRGV